MKAKKLLASGIVAMLIGASITGCGASNQADYKDNNNSNTIDYSTDDADIDNVADSDKAGSDVVESDAENSDADSSKTDSTETDSTDMDNTGAEESLEQQPGGITDEMLSEAYAGLNGTWYEDNDEALDHMEFANAGEVIYRDKDGTTVFKGYVYFTQDENPDGSLYLHCIVIDNETGMMRFGFHYPEEGAISFYDDEMGGKTFMYGSDGVG